MKRFKLILIWALIILVLDACDSSTGESFKFDDADSHAYSEEVSDEDDYKDNSILSSSAADYTDDKRKFIRRADIEMEVQNVYESTTKIENKIGELGGFVAQSNLNSYINRENTFPINADSAIEVRKFTVTNQMTLRLPHYQLNNFLIALGDEVQFLNHRNISADDVHLNLLFNQLEKERLNKSNQNLDYLKHESGKIADKQEVISRIDKNNLNQNQKTVEFLKTQDEIEFSTITLFLSEKEKIAQVTVVNPNSYTEKFRSSFFSEAWSSIKDGFYLLQSLILALLYIWPIIILAALVFIFFRQQKSRKTV